MTKSGRPTNPLTGALSTLPASVVKALLNDRAFLNEFNIPARTIWSVGESGVPLELSTLLSAVRQWYATGHAQLEINEESWDFAWIEVDGRREVGLAKGDQESLLPPLKPLAPDRQVRLDGFDRAARELLLPFEIRDRWRESLSAGPLSDKAFEEFEQDCDLNPLRVLSHLQRQLRRGNASLTELVPPEVSYYEALIGAPTAGGDLTSHTDQATRRCIRLAQDYGTDGAFRALQLAAHPFISKGFARGLADQKPFIDALPQVVAKGGLMTVVAALEAALALVAERAAFREPIEALANRLVELDEIAGPSRYRLLSTLFRMVEGELAATRAVPGMPPVWRRHASLVHAALLEESLAGEPDIERFVDWATVRDPYFYQQTLCDMRREPRWQPWMGGDIQFRAELLGRVVMAGVPVKKALTPAGKRTLLGRGKRSILGRADLGRAFLPGPLEGAAASFSELPRELSAMIESGLSAEVIQMDAIARLANSALIFGITAEQAELAAGALQRSEYDVRGSSEAGQIEGMLQGLATVAAVSRSQALAEDVRVVVRRYLRRTDKVLSPDKALSVGLIAAAAHENEADWSEFFGKWSAELAFAKLSNNEAEQLYANLHWLTRSSSHLARTCSPALSALEAFLGR